MKTSALGIVFVLMVIGAAAAATCPVGMDMFGRVVFGPCPPPPPPSACFVNTYPNVKPAYGYLGDPVPVQVPCPPPPQ